MKKFVVFGTMGCLIVTLISGCNVNYEDGIPVLRNALGEEGKISYDASCNHYVVDMYFEGLYDILLDCFIKLNGNLQPWNEFVKSANVLSAELSKIAPYHIGVSVNYYDTSGTLMISSHSGQTIYDASWAFF